MIEAIAARVWCIWQAFREPEPNMEAWGAWPMWRQPAGKGDE